MKRHTEVGRRAGSAGLRAVGRPYERPTLKPLDRGRWRLLTALHVSTDVLAIAAALVVGTGLRFGWDRFTEGGPYGTWLAVWVPAWWVGLAVVGLYDRHRTENPVEELRHTVNGVTIGAATAIIASFFTHFAVSRLWLAMVWALCLVFVAAGRRAVRKIVHAMRRRGRLRRRAVIVGTDESARGLADAVLRAPWQGLDVLGFVRVNGHAPYGLRPTDRVLGSTEDLRETVSMLRIAEVLVAPSVAAGGHLSDVVSALDGVGVDLRVAPGLDGFLVSKLTVHPLGDRPLVTIERAELRPGARAAKRALDLVLASAALVVAAPVIAACALAVRLDSRGPAFFRQTRIGRGGKPFRVWKLRTMVADAEEQKALLLARNQAPGVLFKITDDPRITRVGRFLRRTSLDELPQIVNVLAGEMSLVGPRPPLPEEVALYDERVGRRLLVRPGITGLWQVNGRSELSFEDYVRFDILYVQNWSVALDLYIMVKTIPALLSRKGAY